MDPNARISEKKMPITQMFASFRLGRTELALSVASLQEVVRVPEKINLIPLAPDYVTGLFSLRGWVIPIVDMARLLKLETNAIKDDQRIAILNVGNVRIGLLFDSTSEILNISPEHAVPVAEATEGRMSLIRGVLRLDGGDRLVEVIDPLAILKIENLPQVLEQTKTRIADDVRKKGKRGQIISFRAGRLEFGLRIAGISEIIRVPEIKETVLTVDNCLGMINLRGNIMPVIDLQKFLRVEDGPTDDEEKKRIVILKLNRLFVGFLVQSVDSIVTYFEEDILPIPMFQQTKVEMMRGLLPLPVGPADERPDQSVIVLNEDRILSDSEIHAMTHGHESLYAEKNSDSDAHQTRAAARKPYISFRLDHLISTRLSAIDEIAILAQGLIRPPGFPEWVMGVMKMRGEVVTVVDLRNFYGMSPHAEINADSKILIVSGSKAKFGLLVDAVESIANIDETEKARVPHLIRPEVGEAFGADMGEVVEMADAAGEKKTYMIMDIPQVLRKLEERIG